MEQTTETTACPSCGQAMVPRVARTLGLQVCDETILDVYRQRDARNREGAALVSVWERVISIASILPMKKVKFVRGAYCLACRGVFLRANALVPAADVPDSVSSRP